MTIPCWIVFFTTGEYSDRVERPVRVFPREAAANAFAANCNEILAAFGCAEESMEDWDDDPRWQACRDQLHALGDTQWHRCSYTGGDYFVAKCEYQP